MGEVRQRLPAGFTAIVQPPFVVIGNEPAGVLNFRAQTVGSAVDRLKAAFFEQDPTNIVALWLFKDQASYERHTTAWLGGAPVTPLGFYARGRQAIFVNLAGGAGTLTHEIVHPFLDANFPGCPTWFNEGLSSLYEQADERAGHIRGLTNWRLTGLHEAIRVRQTVPLARLFAMTPEEFYQPNTACYAQARYLCFYLQERGLLQEFYRRFCARFSADPTGLGTLQEVLGIRDLERFQADWEAFVLKLQLGR